MPKASIAPATRKNKLQNPTWEHPKGSGIKIAQMQNSTGGKGYNDSFQIRIPAKLLGQVGKREMHQRKTKAEAERLAEDRFLALKKHGTEFSKIPAYAQTQAATAWHMLQPHGIDFIEAAKAAIKHLRPAGGRVLFSFVLDEMRDSKQRRFEAKKLDKRSNDDFRSRADKYQKAFGTRPIHEITSNEIKEWLQGLMVDGFDEKSEPLTPRTVLNYRNVLAEVFNYATTKRYCAENPFSHFTSEELKALGGEKAERDVDAINVLTPEEAEKLLETAATPAQVEVLGSLVLRLFCGLRTTEVSKLDWSEVRWLDPKPFVHVTAAKAKKRKIRLVEIPECGLAWLKLCNPPAVGRVVPGKGSVKAYTNRFRKLVEAAGLGTKDDAGKWKSDWESNDTRHSFGSYHYALYGDSIKTATLMGHVQGDDVLFSHYRTLVSKEAAEKYFSLKPVLAAKIEMFPAAAIS